MAERYVFIGKEKFPVLEPEKKQAPAEKPKQTRTRRSKPQEPPATCEV